MTWFVCVCVCSFKLCYFDSLRYSEDVEVPMADAYVAFDAFDHYKVVEHLRMAGTTAHL